MSRNIREIQGGLNMSGTICDLFTHKQSRSYLNHLVQGSKLILYWVCVAIEMMIVTRKSWSVMNCRDSKFEFFAPAQNSFTFPRILTLPTSFRCLQGLLYVGTITLNYTFDRKTQYCSLTLNLHEHLSTVRWKHIKYLKNKYFHTSFYRMCNHIRNAFRCLLVNIINLR
jgi:hypothetical protein